MNLHIGHHFFGAGNSGDDFMLAGFLRSVPARWRGRLTCCVPHDRTALAQRFPEVQWLPYETAAREQAVRRCAAWIGLGGSPFQSAVSRWFIDHLVEERRLCAAAGKPMYFLGVGSQDPAALTDPFLQEVIAQAAHIWTRDSLTATSLSRSASVSAAADLSHILFASRPPPQAAKGRLTAVLNFDYGDWPPLTSVLESLRELPVLERIWAAQEERELPGAERWLYARLPAEERARWRLEVIPPCGSGVPAASSLSAGGGTPLPLAWPSGEWQLSSRYHATLAAAWAGSRAVVIETNAKLRGAAEETGFPLIGLSDPHPAVASRLKEAKPPSAERLQARAGLAAKACAEFFAAVG